MHEASDEEILICWPGIRCQMSKNVKNWFFLEKKNNTMPDTTPWIWLQAVKFFVETRLISDIFCNKFWNYSGNQTTKTVPNFCDFFSEFRQRINDLESLKHYNFVSIILHCSVHNFLKSIVCCVTLPGCFAWCGCHPPVSTMCFDFGISASTFWD